jgi:hypothetical protein
MKLTNQITNAMTKFVELFLIPLLVTIFGGIILLNPLKWGLQARIVLAVAILGFAYFLGHAVHNHLKHKTALASRITQVSRASNSPNIVGNQNRVQIGAIDEQEQMDE